MNKGFRLKRNVYIILAAILALAATMQITRSQYVLQFSRNSHLAGERVPLAAASALAPADPSQPYYCVVFDSGDGYSAKVSGNALRMLQYMKKQAVRIDTAERRPDPEKCRAVIVANRQLGKLGDIDGLADYAEEGGYVMFASSMEQDSAFFRLYRKLGINAFGDAYDANGIRLDSNVLIGEKGLTIDDPFVFNTSNRVELDGGARVLASSLDGNPLLWRAAYGKGAFVVFNGTMLEEKINRGLLAGGISLLEPDFLYPIFNTKQVFIDDFPAPIGSQLVPSIYDNYKKDLRRFYRENWWPDMLGIAKRTGVKYTAGIIQSYNDRVNPPFESPADEDRTGLVTFGREVIKSGGELGIHGYNHQSLEPDPAKSKSFGYNSWPNEEAMYRSVKEVLRYANEVFPNYALMSYIPPSNVLSPEGRKTLKEAWPGLTSISSLYEEDAANLAYVQEYEVAEDGVIEMPRVTSGYADTPFERWAEANAISSLGVYSHFVHPDDVIDEVRNKDMTWQQLYEAFTDKLERVKRTYPWLRDMTATEGAIDMEKALASGVKLAYGADSIRGEIGPFREELSFVLRTERKIGKLSGCQVEKIDENVYLVIADRANFEIGLGG